MRRTRRSHHYAYAITAGERLYSIFLGPFFVICVLFLAVKFFSVPSATNVNFSDLLTATSFTLGRLLVAYVIAVILAIPIAILAVKNTFTEKIFLPMFDVLESVPILAFFPILILFFLRINLPNGAAIFILFLSMLWNIVFTIASGLKLIPRDIIYAAEVFGIKGFRYFKEVTLPAIFPEIVTGSILAFAQGWNLIIVAEVLHTYIPGGTNSQDLFGIGSILVRASNQGDTNLFIASIAVMVVVIALFNFFIWQNLIHYSERFKFE